MKRKRGGRAKKSSLVSAPKATATGTGCSNANETDFGNLENVESQQIEQGLEKLIDQIAADNANTLRKALSEILLNKKTEGTSQQGEPRIHSHDHQYKARELNDSLVAIKNVMKLDAAAPFSIPVDPIALGIPDYHDIIDTPMDFGTICNNLEKGLKYKNSKHVFEDVEYIWKNCLKYNKKGDYILELMKLVKANFIKQWSAAGLYIKAEQHTNVEGTSNAPPPSPFDPAVRHAKCKKGCLVGSTSESPSNSQHHQQPEPSSDEQQSFEQEHADGIVGTKGIGSSSAKKKRGRGPTLHLKDCNTVGRIRIVTNDMGQPIGDEATKLSNFLGIVARDGHCAPLIYSDWRAMPVSYKQKMWQQVQLKFDIDPENKGWVLESIANKWRHWKCTLKTAHYNPHSTDEERLADRDERVLPDQWKYLISFWNSAEGEKRSAINKKIIAQRKFNHVTGRKSFARIREEEKGKRPDGKEPTWAELFILTRTRKDGNPVNAASSTLIETLEKGVRPQDEILLEVTSNGRSDRLLNYGIDGGGGASRVSRGQKLVCAEAIRKVSEVHNMKEKMAAMEQTCAHMGEQMAKMMSMVSSSMHLTVPTTNKSPNLTRPLT